MTYSSANGSLYRTGERDERGSDMDKQQAVRLIKEDFQMCQKMLSAIGSDTRQSIITALMETTYSESGRAKGKIILKINIHDLSLANLA
jgi:hypothetical protein